MIIFLDFDGVLRRDSAPPSRFQADCKSHFESAIRPFDQVRIVISSTWRVILSLDQIRKLFSKDIGGRIVGKTPELEYERQYSRFKEIQKYLAENRVGDPTGSEATAERWVAIDDSPELFPADAPLLLTQSDTGFDGVCAVRLRQMLLAGRDA